MGEDDRVCEMSGPWRSENVGLCGYGFAVPQPPENRPQGSDCPGQCRKTVSCFWDEEQGSERGSERGGRAQSLFYL